MGLQGCLLCYFCYDICSFAKQQFNRCLIQQKVLLVCKFYLFCIYFSLNNFNYPNKKFGDPIKINVILLRKFCGIPAKLLRKKNKTCLGFEVSFLMTLTVFITIPIHSKNDIWMDLWYYANPQPLCLYTIYMSKKTFRLISNIGKTVLKSFRVFIK